MLSLHTCLDAEGAPTTEIVGYDFVSYFRCGDKFFGVASDGVYELTGKTINGDEIDAVLETFNLDFGHDGKKRVRFIYLTIETEGDVIVTPIVDDVERTPVTFSSVTPGKQLLRQPVLWDIDGYNWKFRIENVDGCWFALKKFEALPINLSLGR